MTRCKKMALGPKDRIVESSTAWAVLLGPKRRFVKMSPEPRPVVGLRGKSLMASHTCSISICLCVFFRNLNRVNHITTGRF